MSFQKTLYGFLTCVLLCVPGFAQSTSGEIVGTVYDQTGAVIPGAAVQATNNATGTFAKTVSTSSGQYRIPNLSVGGYKLAVTADGFTRVELNNIAVELNRTATANVTLQIGQAVTSLEVTVGVPTIDTTN